MGSFLVRSKTGFSGLRLHVFWFVRKVSRFEGRVFPFGLRSKSFRVNPISFGLSIIRSSIVLNRIGETEGFLLESSCFSSRHNYFSAYYNQSEAVVPQTTPSKAWFGPSGDFHTKRGGSKRLGPYGVARGEAEVRKKATRKLLVARGRKDSSHASSRNSGKSVAPRPKRGYLLNIRADPLHCVAEQESHRGRSAGASLLQSRNV